MKKKHSNPSNRIYKNNSMPRLHIKTAKHQDKILKTAREQTHYPQRNNWSKLNTQQTLQMPESNRTFQVSSMCWGKVTVTFSGLYPVILTFKRRVNFLISPGFSTHKLLVKTPWNYIHQEEELNSKEEMGEQRKCKQVSDSKLSINCKENTQIIVTVLAHNKCLTDVYWLVVILDHIYLFWDIMLHMFWAQNTQTLQLMVVISYSLLHPRSILSLLICIYFSIFCWWGRGNSSLSSL